MGLRPSFSLAEGDRDTVLFLWLEVMPGVVRDSQTSPLGYVDKSVKAERGICLFTTAGLNGRHQEKLNVAKNN